MSPARHWRDQGKRDEAGELLAPVYAWFAEGFDTLDPKEAKGVARRIGVTGDIALESNAVIPAKFMRGRP